MKILISLITLTVLANASYEKAQEYYEAKNYKEAIEEAKGSTSEYSNPKLHLLWAKSAEALGNSEEAMSAYERAAMLDETNSESRLALHKIYKQSNRENLAKEMSSELENYQLTPAQRSSLDLVSGTDIHSIKSQATLALGHDSNINISAKENDLYTSIVGEKSTLFARVNGSVSYVNELEDKAGWYLRGDLKAYYQNNFDASYYNMFVGTGEAGVGYAGSNYSVYLPVGYDRINYLESDLLGQLRIAPRVNVSLNKNFLMSADLKYAIRTYQDAKYKGMNDTGIGAGAGLYYLFDKNFAYLKLKYEDYTASETIKFNFVDKNFMTLSIGANYNVKDWFVARVDYRYRSAEYSDTITPTSMLSAEKRADQYNQLELKLSHYLAKNYELFVSDKYIKNSSNYIPAEYTKNIFMFGISANY